MERGYLLHLVSLLCVIISVFCVGNELTIWEVIPVYVDICYLAVLINRHERKWPSLKGDGFYFLVLRKLLLRWLRGEPDCFAAS